MTFPDTGLYDTSFVTVCDAESYPRICQSRCILTVRYAVVMHEHVRHDVVPPAALVAQHVGVGPGSLHEPRARVQDIRGD